MLERKFSDTVLRIIAEEAAECDRRAKEAFLNHKESITEYWLCTENRFQSLHDKIAKALNRPDRLLSGDFKTQMQAFREEVRRG